MYDDGMGDGPPMAHAEFDRQAQYGRLRAAMVRDQLVPRGISDERVLAAMNRVPRHLFVADNMRQFAYDDRALPIEAGQTISQPYIVAMMTQTLAVQAGERVLEVGTGSGYQAAVLVELGAEVFSIERHPQLSAKVLQLFKELGYNTSIQVHLLVGDGTLGWPPAAPYDAIIVTAGAPVTPPALTEQLREGGRLLIPVGNEQQQQLVLYKVEGGRLIEQGMIPCVFVPLIGVQGWAEDAPQVTEVARRLAGYMQQPNTAAIPPDLEPTVFLTRRMSLLWNVAAVACKLKFGVVFAAQVVFGKVRFCTRLL